jgi:hypothetical protein
MNATPECNCPTCGAPMRVEAQHWTHRPDSLLCTCDNPACAAYGATGTVETIAETQARFVAAPAPVECAAQLSYREAMLYYLEHQREIDSAAYMGVVEARRIYFTFSMAKASENWRPEFREAVEAWAIARAGA